VRQIPINTPPLGALERQHQERMPVRHSIRRGSGWCSNGTGRAGGARTRSDAQEARLHGHLVQRHLVAIRKTNPDRAAHLADLLGLMAKASHLIPRHIELPHPPVRGLARLDF
jgi:hypothetical protein